MLPCYALDARMARGHSSAQQARAGPHRVPAAPYAEWASGAPIKRAGRGGEWAVALARAYNDWIHDRFTRVSPRLRAVALLPVQDVGEAVRELRRCVAELGMPGAVLPAVIHGARTVAGPEFDPLWAAAEELD